MKIILNNYIEKYLKKEFNWGEIIFYFTLYGICIYFMSKEGEFLRLESNLVSKYLTIITIGFLFGNISCIILSYLIKLTGRLFHSKPKFKDILKALTVSFRPNLVSVLLIFIQITIAHYFKSDLIQENLILISVFIIIQKILLAAIGILSIVILVNGLKIILNQSIGKTLINYMIASFLYFPIYIVLMRM